MINHATFDRLEDAIDRFEETWSPDSQSTIETLLSEFGLSNDDEAIVEMIRIDIELRYERGLSIDLSDYLRRFGILLDRPERIAEIAFEDYRSRSANGRTVSPARWSKLPGVSHESWFQELSRNGAEGSAGSSSVLEGFGGIAESSIELALEQAGFRLVQKIGEGAFSEVYLAVQSDLANRFVVLKMVQDSLAEPEYMAQMQHTNIVPIYSYHRVLSHSVICMPYAGGVTLADFLNSKSDVSTRGGQSLVMTVRDRMGDTKSLPCDDDDTSQVNDFNHRVPAAEDTAATRPLHAFESFDCGELAIWIFTRLASALAHAHARGVLHNDLKPSNVLIRNDGEPALLDFNLSQSLEQVSPRRAGGTLPYMSPETFRVMMGQKGRGGVASDLYGLGVMLFEFVTGRLPYPAPTSIAATDLDEAIKIRRMPPSWQESDQVSPGVVAIVNRCLNFDPNDRYQSADDLLTDLQHEQQSLPLQHAQEPLQWRFRKWRQRYPRAIASTSVAIVLLALLIPAIYLAVDSMQTNQALQAEANFKSFEEESNEFLSMLMADPKRHEERYVERGIRILKQHGVFSESGAKQFVLTADAKKKKDAQTLLLRHVVHVGMVESDRLLEAKIAQLDHPIGIESLDKLLSIANAIDQPGDSRACRFLEADRAKLSGDAAMHARLLQNAHETVVANDNERYLEAVRLHHQYDAESASELLAALADRGAVPPGLRWTLLGRAQMNKGQFEDAILSLTQSLERVPHSSMLHVLRARCYFELRHDIEAEQDYRRAIELDSNNLRAWSQLGLLCHATRRYDEAVRCYNRALELQPERIWTYLKRSKAYRALNKDNLAQADFQTALQIETDAHVELMFRAKAQVDLNPLAAIDDIQAAQHLCPDNPYYIQLNAWILATKLGRHEEAVELYDQVLEIQKDNEHALIDSALSLVRLGKKDEALHRTRLAMSGENEAVNLYQAACVHALVGRAKNQRRAVTLLARAIREGYQPKDLASDSDLDSVREMEEFKTIQTFFETSQRNGPTRAAANRGDQGQSGPTIFDTDEIITTRTEKS